MAYVCPYCGEIIDNSSKCTRCDQDLEWVQKINEKSKLYYFKGYQEAQERNLTVAATYLKKAVYFNKFNIDARNLLGLVYFEMGKIGSALKQWIISASLSKEDNIAVEYIDKIQNSPKMLITYKDSISLYNKALMYLKQKNNDMAIIRLKKAVSLNSNLTEARNLLALCYIKEKQFYKANEQIKNVLAIDASDMKALSYFKMLSKQDTATIQPYELEYIPKQSKNNYVKPSKVINRGHALAIYVMYFIIGSLFMFIIQSSLITPNKTKSYENTVANLRESETKLKGLLEETRIKSQDEIDTLKAENQQLMEEKQDIELATSKIAQKEKLSQATIMKNNKEWIEAAEILYNVAPSLLDEEAARRYDELKKEVYPRVGRTLYDEGYRHFNRKELIEAKTKLEKAILYDPTADVLRKSLYYLGRVEKEQGNAEKAKYYFNTVVEQNPGTNEANWAAAELKGLQE
ncbi:tetratricopeptide repeat protein [Cellulosilyticum sp. I15G10I2]|uniref:tetratricopeptide repeat protein n=1 Tax=Cellulosilyticum sp. I15G10I2 TaxID=1892843 RepID=UPI00085C5C67|nr:tetratricopeptide repeat protein [Cellulosilyticum sp. I15G10I2]